MPGKTQEYLPLLNKNISRRDEDEAMHTNVRDDSLAAFWPLSAIGPICAASRSVWHSVEPQIQGDEPW